MSTNDPRLDIFLKDTINTKLLRDHLKQEGRLTEECALKIINDGELDLFREIFASLNIEFRIYRNVLYEIWNLNEDLFSE